MAAIAGVWAAGTWYGERNPLPQATTPVSRETSPPAPTPTVTVTVPGPTRTVTKPVVKVVTRTRTVTKVRTRTVKVVANSNSLRCPYGPHEDSCRMDFRNGRWYLVRNSD